MSAIYGTTIKGNRLNVVNDAINGKTYSAGAGAGTSGVLVLGTSTLSGATGIIANITLQNPAGVVSIPGSSFTISGLPISGTASATGVLALAEIRDSAGNVIVAGLTVGAIGSSADIIVSALSITAGQAVTLTAGTITHG